MTRILFVGDLRPGSRSKQRLSALERLGLTTTAIPTVPLRDGAPGTRRPSLLARVAHRLGRPLDRAGTSRAVRAALAESTFDVLWVEKALALDPSLVRDARGVRAFFSEDDMARAHNQSHRFLAALPHYDIVFTTKPRNADAEGPLGLARLGARRVELLPKSYDPQLHRPIEIDAEERAHFGADVAFVGTWEAERANSLSRLADAGLEVRVWGNGWSGRSLSPRLRIEGRPAIGEEYARVLAATKVQLGFLRRANGDGSTARSVEIPAAGAYLLTERTEEHAALFREGVEAEFFSDDEELLAKVRRALASDADRERIAATGRARVIADGRSHETVLRTALGLAREVGR